MHKEFKELFISQSVDSYRCLWKHHLRPTIKITQPNDFEQRTNLKNNFNVKQTIDAERPILVLK